MAELAARCERACAAVKVLLARRASQCGAWQRAGIRSPAEWLGQMSGGSPSQAHSQLEAARWVAAQPEVADAWRRGDLSSAQAEQVSRAAEADPSAAGSLVERAQHESLAGLRKACLEVEAAARSAEGERDRHRRIHAERYLHVWRDDEGAGRLAARMTPDALARLEAAVEPFETEVFEAARLDGRRERFDAYSADALLAMAAASADGEANGMRLPAQVIVRVDHAALVRGEAETGDLCEIDGIGPVPVAAVQAMMADAVLSTVVTDGADIRSVSHVGRTSTSAQRAALVVRDPVCVVPGCGVSRGLEIDHVDPWALTRTTRLDQLARLCHHHHALKTYGGWLLSGTPGHWRFTPPDGTTGATPDQIARQRRPPSPPAASIPGEGCGALFDPDPFPP